MLRKVLLLSFLTFAFYFTDAQNLKRRAYMGSVLVNLNDSIVKAHHLTSNDGVMITQTIEGGTAQKIGLNSGDIILSINNIQIKTRTDFMQIISKMKADEDITFVVVRKNKNKIIKGKTMGYKPDN